MSDDSFNGAGASPLRQRLWGAVVLIAIAVIFLPLILDGAGSESQFRQIDRLREEPPGVEASLINSGMPASTTLSSESSLLADDTGAGEQSQAVVSSVQSSLGVKNDAILAEARVRETLSGQSRPLLTAWVVQAAAFTDEADAIEQRDQLRRAGFASFVRNRETDTKLFHVLVGPIIKQDSAEKVRQRVAVLLKNEPIIVTYP